MCEKFQHRVGKCYRLFDIGNMRGVEHGQRGARYPAVDELRRGEWRAAAYAGFARTRNPI
jgi:hypothetical protein